MSVISAEQIYEWRDSQRQPNIDKDIIEISNTFNLEQVFENARAYIDYISNYNNHHEDIERDTCSFLVQKGGLYDSYLLEAYLEWVGSEEDLDEFHENGISESSFFDYMNAYKSVELKRELLFHYLKCYEFLFLNSELYNFHREKFDILLRNEMKIPSDFSSNYSVALSNLFKKVCLLLSAEKD
jgi:hypothetical protein